MYSLSAEAEAQRFPDGVHHDCVVGKRMSVAPKCRSTSYAIVVLDLV